MKEEFTTAMHEELIGTEMSHFDLMVFAAAGAMDRGLSKAQALEKYGLTEQEFDDNIERVLLS